ncbi:MAG: MCP four helix bundle domain-containing protein [Anaerolineae bacterium]|nr:MCP four helix bundle domain-containing protein [Anaerolineae bacterium]
MLKKLSITYRLSILIAFFVGLFIILGLIAFLEVGVLGQSIQHMGTEDIALLENMRELRDHMSDAIIVTAEHVLSNDSEVMANLEEEIAADRAAIDETWVELEAIFATDYEHTNTEEIQAEWQALITIQDRVLRFSAQNLKANAYALAGDEGEYAVQYDVVVELIEEMEPGLHQEVADHLASSSDLATRTAPMLIFFATAAAVVVAVGAGWWLARSITQPLARLREGVQKIGAGDLNHRIANDSQDEIGTVTLAFNQMTDNLQQMVESEKTSREVLQQTVSEFMNFVERVSKGDLASRLSLNDDGRSQAEDSEDLYRLGENLNVMVESLNTITRQVREAVSSITSASAEIQAATTQQIASTTEQDATVTQTVATVEEVRTTVQQTAERAQAVADAAQQSVAVSRQGEEAVDATMDGMMIIRQRVENIAETILSLSERTQQIGEIINTVNAIADQSKLLALNASIEAARAGEEGRGFAVVAAEVRQLAEQSRQATARIGEILNEIQQATNTAVMVTEEGSKGAERGMELVTRAGEAIRDLAATLEEATQAAVQIAASTHQQTNGMSQLGSAMQQIKQASTQSAASSRQTEQSARDLTQMARALEAATNQYILETS